MASKDGNKCSGNTDLTWDCKIGKIGRVLSPPLLVNSNSACVNIGAGADHSEKIKRYQKYDMTRKENTPNVASVA